MHKILLKASFIVFLATIFLLFSQNCFAGGFYLPEVGSPGSVGTAGVANVVNNFGTDSALTNPADYVQRMNKLLLEIDSA